MKNRGISLVTLIIIIIIIIILASVVILNITKNNPIDSATKAKVMEDYDTFSSNLQLTISDRYAEDQSLRASKINTPPYNILELIPSMEGQKLSGLEYREIYIVIRGDLVLKTDLELERDLEEGQDLERQKQLRDEVQEILGLKRRGEEESNVEPNKPVITLYYSDGTLVEDGKYTSDDVTAKIETNMITVGYHMQYHLSTESEWTELTSAQSEVAITENCNIMARIIDSEGEVVSITEEYEINVIDKMPPTTPTSLNLTPSVNGVEAVASGSTDEESGFSKYEYSMDNTSWQDSGRFEGIKSSTSITIYARAVDNVGNVSGIISSSGATTGIGKVTITPNTNDWTKNDVTVTIAHSAVSGYTLQYSYDGKTWNKYTSSLTISENKTVYGRMYNTSLDDEGDSAASKDITNIDKDRPSAPKNINTTVDVNSIIAEATGSIDSLSGILKYQYSMDDVNWQDVGEFTNIKSGTDVIIYARAVDNAGNISESKSNASATSLVGKVTITPSKTAWTKDDITVTLSHSEISGYTLQYSYDGTSWNNYVSALTISENKTIYGRMYNSTLDDEGNSANSIDITNIDKTPPSVPNSVRISALINLIEVNASGSSDNTDGIGFWKYQYSLDNKSWTDNSTFTGIKSGTSVTVYVRALDRLGNASDSKSSSGTTFSISKVNIFADPAIDWTSGNVTVTLEHPDEGNGYTLQYSYNGTSWNTYSSALSIDSNRTVYARLYNSSLDDEGNSANSIDITNIDKTPPSVPTSVTLSNITYNSVKATAYGSTDEGIGLAGYQYSLDNKSWTDNDTFTGINSGTSVTIYARAVDSLGNASTSKASSSSTTNNLGKFDLIFVAGTSFIDLSEWTNKDIIIEATKPGYSKFVYDNDAGLITDEELRAEGSKVAQWRNAHENAGYVCQYSYDGKNWTNGFEPTVSSNCTVYFRWYNASLDDAGDSETTISITKIDKAAPNPPTSATISTTETTITVKASGASDTEGSKTIKGYRYSIDNSSWSAVTADSYTFNNVPSGTTKTIYMKAVDGAGNESTSYTRNATTQVAGYTVTYKDVIGSTTGNELGTQTKTKKVGQTASGSELGTDNTVGKYYTDYAYVSSTSATVNGNVTVYRIFKYGVITFSNMPGTNWVGSLGGYAAEAWLNYETYATIPAGCTVYYEVKSVPSSDLWKTTYCQDGAGSIRRSEALAHIGWQGFGGMLISEDHAGFYSNENVNTSGKTGTLTTTEEKRLMINITCNGMIEFDSLMVWVSKITDSTGFTYIVR